MAQATMERCAHPNCTCPVSAGEEYCSQACADADEATAAMIVAPVLIRSAQAQWRLSFPPSRSH